MIQKYFILLALLFLFRPHLNAQEINSDSTGAAKAFFELLSICKNVDFGDPKTTSIGTFYKAAALIIYRGEDKERAWKDFANYANPDEKTGVDEICYRINSSVNQDSALTIIGYETDTESEGTWHTLIVSFIKKGVEKKAAFAFLKIEGKYGLGDID